MANIARESNAFIKSYSLLIQATPEKMESNRSSLLKKNCRNGISCVPLLKPQTLVSGLKMHQKNIDVFNLFLPFVII